MDMKMVAKLIALILTLSVSICLGQTPRKAEDFYQRGLVRQEKGDVEGAIADFSKAIEIDPQHADAYYNRGSLRQTKGDMDAAIADFNKTIEINPQYAEAYADRGLARLSQGLDAEAQKDFNKYLELDQSMKVTLEQRIKYVKYQRDKKRKS
jgi:tetratricopeptide (TPR) repeat protein